MRFPRHLIRPVGLLLGLGLLAGVVTAGFAYPVAAGIGLVANDASDSIGSVSTDVVDQPLPQTTIITDSQGGFLAQLFEPDQNRRSVSAEDISPAMKAAIVAIEDRRFYQHAGVDWQGTLRALVTNSVSGSVEQGASTLTQQYVKNYELFVVADTETERLRATEQTPARKLREVQVALQLEQTLSKEEILTRYLNIVPFGNGAAGISSAARTYFNTTPDLLTVPQAALLAGMVRSTSAYDPVNNPQNAIDRRNIVINEMLTQQMIDQTQATEALATPLGIIAPLITQPNGCIGAGDAGFFCQYVQEYLAEAGFSTEQLRRGGYTIQTTLDRRSLEVMQASLLEQVPADTPDVADVMATVQPGADRHRVTAMGSSRVFGLNADAFQTSYGLPYEPVPQGAGSIYKIFTSATALEHGLGINYQLLVPPSGYASPIYIDGGGRPLPVQNSGTYSERLSITDALAQSPNTAFVRLLEFTGVPDVVNMAVRLGMRSLATTPYINPNTGQPTDRSIAQVTSDQRQASFTLGVSPTSVLELANVGATIASSGMWCPPTPIESITDVAGNPVPVTEAPCEQVVEPGLANALFTALSHDDLPGGTAAGAASRYGWDRPMGGKTGTTQDHKSAAFLGVVPQLAGAAMIFDNDNRPSPLCQTGGAPRSCGSGNVFGGGYPANTWFNTMTQLLEGQPTIPLPPVEDRFLNGGAETRVPDVVGRGENAARAELERAGFPVTTRTVDNAAEEGTVIGQSPRGTALPGESVQLSISSGEVPPPPQAPGTTAPVDPNAPPADGGTPPPDGGILPPDGGDAGDGQGGDGEAPP